MLIPMHQIRKEYGSGPGRHWFDPGSMRFFRSRLAQYGYRGPGGTFFVSSEQFDHDAPRLYSVRKLEGPGKIETVGDFQAYRSRDAAHRAAKGFAG